LKYYVTIGDETTELEVIERSGKLIVTIAGREIIVDVQEINPPSLFSLLLDNRSYELFVEAQGEDYNVLVGDELYQLQVQDEWSRRLASIQALAQSDEGELEIKAPMPGVVVAVEVEPGADVKRDQGLVILSAMKMENEIKAPRDGTVKSVEVVENQIVQHGQTLVVIE
jgi:biotin carboxyl carrier protein